jgi:CRISPR-associated protein Csd1
MEIALKDAAGLARMDTVPPAIESALMRSILGQAPYPAALYAAVLERVRAEGVVTPLRAGMIKGCLIRNEKEEVGMGLDLNERDVPYLMGRLFALYEKAQVEAIEHLNASITDKYLNAAMATPRTVFPTLFQMNQKHIAKTRNYYLSGKISEVWDLLAIDASGSDAPEVRGDDPNKYVFPATMSANAQGKFILGYYHQNKALYTKKADDKKPSGDEGGNSHAE